MRDYINIGATPAAEDCLQLGADNYSPHAAIMECKRFIQQLKKQFGEPPPLTSLKVHSFDHDFGVYHEVVCWYEDEVGEAYALKCEEEAWEEWRDNGTDKQGATE